MKRTIGLVALMLISAAAFADGPQVYGFAAIGKARTSVGNDKAWNAGVGVQLNSVLALEAGYYDLGKYNNSRTFNSPALPAFGHPAPYTETSDASGHVKGIGLSAKVGVPVGGFFPYVRLGTLLDQSSYDDKHFNVDDGHFTLSHKSSTTPRTMFGAGVGYKFVTVDFLQVQDVGLWEKTNAKQVTIGLRVPF